MGRPTGSDPDGWPKWKMTEWESDECYLRYNEHGGPEVKIPDTKSYLENSTLRF